MSLPHMCPDCGSVNVVISNDKDQVICKDCGLIFEPYAVMAKEEPPKETTEWVCEHKGHKKPSKKSTPKKIKPAKKSSKKKR